jgi:hypothetical protein
MNKTIALIVAGAALALAGGAAQARSNVAWSIGINVPGPVYSQPVYSQPVYSQPVYGAPVYSAPAYSPPPTYYPPQQSYYQAPVPVYNAAPVYYQPRAFVPAPIIYIGNGGRRYSPGYYGPGNGHGHGHGWRR